MEDCFKRANEETKEWKSRQVDRFNPSTPAWRPSVSYCDALTYYYKTGIWHPIFTNK